MDTSSDLCHDKSVLSVSVRVRVSNDLISSSGIGELARWLCP